MTNNSTQAFAAFLDHVTWPINLTSAQITALVQGYGLVLAANQHLNLTRLLEPADYWEKHLWDSLKGLTLLDLPSQGRMIDVGSGAGFPGIPIAISLPTWAFTLLDATQRKVAFLQELAESLGLANVKAVAGRAETLGQERAFRAQYDLATIRAVGSAPECLEYCLPFLKVGGQALLYRGHWTTAEADTCAAAAQQLGGTVVATHAFTTPITTGQRHCLIVRKTQATPLDFPRRPGIPKQQPLA